MKLTQKDCLRPPSKKYDLTEWSFVGDLRGLFKEYFYRSNVDICCELKRRGVITKKDEVDTEYSCTFIYFECKEDAVAFLKRLNAIPEIKYY